MAMTLIPIDRAPHRTNPESRFARPNVANSDVLITS
jgi:hypothetical protein